MDNDCETHEPLRRLGLIGCGSMGSSMFAQLASSDHLKRMGFQPPVVVASPTADFDRHPWIREWGCQTARSNDQVLSVCSTVFIATIPEVVQSVIQGWTNWEGKDVLSVVSGISMETLESWGLSATSNVVRLMPNVNVAVGEGVTGVVFQASASAEFKISTLNLLGPLGKLCEIDESQIDTLAVVFGASPSYLFSLLESLALAGVVGGLPHNQARELACRTAYGAAKMYGRQTQGEIPPGSIGSLLENVLQRALDKVKKQTEELKRGCGDS